jgi:hypothetical protein
VTDRIENPSLLKSGVTRAEAMQSHTLLMCDNGSARDLYCISLIKNQCLEGSQMDIQQTARMVEGSEKKEGFGDGKSEA